MTIEIKELKKVNFDMWLKDNNLNLRVNARELGMAEFCGNIHGGSKEDYLYHAAIKNCNVKKGSFLSGTFGNGATPFEAISNYIPEILETIIVIGAYTDSRKEIKVPSVLKFNQTMLKRMLSEENLDD